MGVFIDHVNVVLSKLRGTAITSLSTNANEEAFRTQIAVQRAVTRVWNSRKWTFKQRTDTLSLTSGTSIYNFPKQVGESYSIRSLDASSIGKKVTVLSQDLFDTHIPDPQNSGWPVTLIMFNMLGSRNDPSSSSVLTLASSSASDTSQSITIRGIVGGDIDVEEIALSGVTEVSTTRSFTSIISIGKSAVTTGRVTITSNSAAVTIVVLSPQEQTIKLREFRAYPQPDATYTLQFKNFGMPPILTSRYQDSEISPRWDYIIEQYAFAFVLQSKGQDQLQEFTTQIQFADKMLELDMATEESQSTEVIIRPQKPSFGTLQGNLWQPPSGRGFTEELF